MSILVAKSKKFCFCLQTSGKVSFVCGNSNFWLRKPEIPAFGRKMKKNLAFDFKKPEIVLISGLGSQNARNLLKYANQRSFYRDAFIPVLIAIFSNFFLAVSLLISHLFR